MLSTRPGIGLALAVALGACGGEAAEPNLPDPIYPALAGNYQILGDFDGIPDNIGWLDGTFSIQQPSRAQETFGGNAHITVHLDGELFEFVYPLSSATVTTGGAVTFVMREGPSNAWTFVSQLSGTSLAGNHTLIASGAIGALTGSFSASRTGGSGSAGSLAVAPVDRTSPTLAALLERMRAP
ncbi:MAG TPA: hypothetical protein VFT04_10540 [Gemmatimonadales bacterium]|nr:hypothetical protein [Gemmatimonadales bacterium]